MSKLKISQILPQIISITHSLGRCGPNHPRYITFIRPSTIAVSVRVSRKTIYSRKSKKFSKRSFVHGQICRQIETSTGKSTGK